MCITPFRFNRNTKRKKNERVIRNQKQTINDGDTDSPSLHPSGYGSTPNPLYKESVQGTTDERQYTPFNVGKTLIDMSEELGRSSSQEPDVPSVKKLGVPIIKPKPGMEAMDQRYVEHSRDLSTKKKEIVDNGPNEEQKVRLGYISARPVEWHRQKTADSQTQTNDFVSPADQEFPMYRKTYKEKTGDKMTEGSYMQIRKNAVPPPPYYIPEVDYEPSHLNRKEYPSRQSNIHKQFFPSEAQNKQQEINSRAINYEVSNNTYNTPRENNSQMNEYRGTIFSEHVNGEVYFRQSSRRSSNESSRDEFLSKQKLGPRDQKNAHLSQMKVTRQSEHFKHYSEDSNNFNVVPAAPKNSAPSRGNEGYDSRIHWVQPEPPELSKEKLRRVQKLGVSVFPE